MNERAIIQPQRVASSLSTQSHAGVAQRKCSCGEAAGLTLQCVECASKRLTVQRRPTIDAIAATAPLVVPESPMSPDHASSSERPEKHLAQTELKLGVAGNAFERHADEMADQVLRGTTVATHTINSDGNVAGEPLPAEITDRITRATSGGHCLDRPEQDYFASKFGHDFSKVRVHHDSDTVSLARKLNAKAFTVGSHVFFNSGAYQPKNESGRKLLAHELAHVVQQERGLVSRQVQRANISYRQVTWDDFKGSVPSGSTFSAETSSGFDTPKWQAKVEDADTKEACEVGKKKSTKHTTKLSIDPTVFDAIQATMSQEKSWVLPKYKNPDKHCPTVTTQCEAGIDKQATEAAKLCKQEIKPCQDVFDQGSTRYKNTVDGTEIVANSREECSAKLVSDCEKILAKNQLFDVKEKCDGAVVVKATTKADCSSKKFKDDCLKYYKDWSARLLKHEQGHFDISNVMAGKARADLKTMSAKFTATATECGEKAAKKEAFKKFNALNPATDISKRGQDWIDLKNKAEKDYDDQTNHGCKLPEQATWEKNITAGLKAYDLNKPASPAQPNPKSAPAGTGAQGANMDLEQDNRVVEADASGDDDESQNG